MSGRFSARCSERFAFVHDELQPHGVGRFDCSAGDFAISLCGVRIACIKHCAFMEYRYVEGGAGNELFAVEIASKDTGWSAATIRAIRIWR